MSAVLDFRELRDKVLAGEMEDDEEPVENTTMTELKSLPVVIPLGLTVGIGAALIYDRFANGGGMFGNTGGMALLTVGGISLGLGVGGLKRGAQAQTEKDRYERLLDESQSVIEEQQEEMESMEAESEEKEAEEQHEAENDYQYDYLSAEDSFFHGPSLGMGVGAFGQEGVLYRPKATDQLW
jgi:hypothetical protein